MITFFPYKQKKENATVTKQSSSNFFLPLIQPKRSINQPNDMYEQEADAMADKVMSQNGSALHNQPFFTPPAFVQRKDKPVEREEEQLQRKETSQNERQAGNATEAYQASSEGKGHSLTEAERSFFEPHFGHDFSNVHLHTDMEANHSAESINALAYTHGNNIVFGNNQYQPDSDSGKRLLAHELTHVVQQNNNTNKSIQRAPATKAALIKKITQAGFTAVEDDGTASFSEDELTLIVQAINGLPAGDKAAIKGARLLRVKTLPGEAAGDYSNEQGYKETTATNKQEIRLNDKAFSGGISSGESLRLITHEIGHAVAAMKHRLAMNEEIPAGVKLNQLVNTFNIAVGAFNADNDVSNAAIDESNMAIEVYNEATKGTDQKAIAAAKADMDKKRAIANKLKAVTAAKEKIMVGQKAAVALQEEVLADKKQTEKSMLANVDDLEKEADDKLVNLENVFKGASALLKGNDVESTAYRTSLTDAEEALKKFYDENVKVANTQLEANNAKAVADGAIRNRNKERDDLKTKNPGNTVLSGMSALETAQDSFLETASLSALNKQMTLPVRKFFDFVKSNKISATLTKYAAENWPQRPEEFYAEAYSFFVTKPKELEAFSKLLYDWFKAGNYK